MPKETEIAITVFVVRIFSAADSDDVRLLAQYVAKRRPWATIMAIGWGFGANMLAKYLGEEANATPLTAAVCIDNPFSLDKDIHSAPPSRWSSLDRALTKGLIQILDNNKVHSSVVGLACHMESPLTSDLDPLIS